MREIKFRAWDKANKLMVEVVDISFYIEIITAVHPSGHSLFILKFNDAKLLQYTGLKDKNGKEIYEGDIINEMGNCNYVIVYGGNHPLQSASFMAVSINDYVNKNKDYLNHIFQSWTKKTKIIGNIYENPELIEVK